jgi:diaminopimelate decarboxylase
MTELIRPALYGARHPIVALTSLGREAAGREAAGREAVGREAVGREAAGRVAAGRHAARGWEPTHVEGPICESTDSLGTHELPPLRRGDLVAIADAGAYAASLGSSYNGRPRPPQVLLGSDGTFTIGRRRGTLAALG